MKDPRREAGRWIEQARMDLEAVRTIAGQGLWWIACFQAQQAAEKAVKAFLYSSGERMVLGHSVAELVGRAASEDSSFGDLKPAGVQLDRFYIPTRYPNGLPGGIPAESYSEADAQSALQLAERVMAFVGKKLGTLGSE